MGDRANVFIREIEAEPDVGVFLYTHWGGSDLAVDVKNALLRGTDRWDDLQYLARIIFCEMIGERHLKDTTGLGISAMMCDNEHLVIVLQPNQRVSFCKETDQKLGQRYGEWSFAEYAAMSDDDINRAYLQS